VPVLKHRLAVLIVLAMVASGCAAGRAYRKGQESSRVGDWDSAVTHYTQAVQENPEKAEYKIALERATQNASREHLSRAHDLEEHDQLDAALLEYKRALELDASNRLAAAKSVELEKTIRDRIESSRPKPPIQGLREEARRASTPVLNPTAPVPVITFGPNASVRDILNFIGSATGINVTYDAQYQDKAYAVRLEDVTLEQALQQVTQANQFFYKVLNPKTIIIVPDNAQKHAQYDDLVVKVFYISHADVAEISQIINTIMRIPTMPVQPTVLQNKTANTLTVRATAPVMDVIERIIKANDKPRAEVIVDVQILEVNRKRTKDLGLNLSAYALGLTFSPEAAPPNTSNTLPNAPTQPPPFNLNTISQGISTADFYLSVPTALIKFLETDSRTKVIAKPQLRGAEGTKLTLNLGDQIPVLSTVFGAQVPGGLASVPQSSFNYKDVGVNLEMTPRVTYEGEIVLDAFTVESSALGPSISVAGQDVPSFSSRKVTTKLRLREGESTLLAGLLRDEQRKILSGFPGITKTPILRSLFGSTSDEINQSDIVMLLTPHIVRTHELTVEDLSSIYIGTQQNVGLGGPPPLIAPQPNEPPPAGAATAPGAQPPTVAGSPASLANPPGGVPPTNFPVPPGASPTPALVTPLPTAPPGTTPPPANAPTNVTPPPVAPPAAGAAPGATPPGVTPAGAAPTGTPPTGAVPGAAPRDITTTPPTTPPAGAAAVNASAAQIIVTSPGTEYRVAGGPYTVPISINNVSRLSVITLTVTYNSSVLRVRQTQDGTFMRQGNVAASFTPRIDAAAGRVDIAITRTSDSAGASGAGLLAALVFDAIGPGNSTIQVSGVASTPEGAPIALQFNPVSVTVR
jgi:type II secretory pathway component GspD/PulD (secretin)